MVYVDGSEPLSKAQASSGINRYMLISLSTYDIRILLYTNFRGTRGWEMWKHTPPLFRPSSGFKVVVPHNIPSTIRFCPHLHGFPIDGITLLQRGSYHISPGCDIDA